MSDNDTTSPRVEPRTRGSNISPAEELTAVNADEADNPRVTSNISSTSPAATFTAINADAESQPRRLRHVSQQAAQQYLDADTMAPDDGPEPGFGEAPHGTDYMTTSDQYNDNEQAAVPTIENEEAETSSKKPSSKSLGKRKRALSSEAPGEDTQKHPGRKPGGEKVPTPPSWTDRECIALMKLYLKNPASTHKQVAALHTSTFWANSRTERTGPACTQRYVALGAKGVSGDAHDRSKIPAIIAALEAKVASEADDGVDEEAEENSDGVSLNTNGKQRAGEGDHDDEEPRSSGSSDDVETNGIDRISVVFFDLSGKGQRTNASEDSFPEDSSDDGEGDDGSEEPEVDADDHVGTDAPSLA